MLSVCGLSLMSRAFNKRITSFNVCILKFLTSLYSSISIETACNAFKLIWDNYTILKRNLICFKPRFLLFRLSKYCQVNFVEAFILNRLLWYKLPTVMYPLCFEKQTLELVLKSSFKVKLPTNDLQDISWFQNQSRRENTVAMPPSFP